MEMLLWTAIKTPLLDSFVLDYGPSFLCMRFLTISKQEQ